MLEKLTPPDRSPPCKISRIREGLDMEDRQLLGAFLKDCDSWTARELSVALRRQGIEVSTDTIRRYRQRHGLC